MRSTADRVVTDLLSAGLVDPTRAAEARTVVRRALDSPDDEVPATRTLLIELGAYVGGALVLVAAGGVGWAIGAGVRGRRARDV